MQIKFNNIKKEVAMLPMITRRNYKPLTLSDFLNEDFFPTFARSSTSLPAVNIREDEKAFYLELAVPGMEKKDLKIEVKDDVSPISAEQKEEKQEDLRDTGAWSSVTAHSAAVSTCLRMSA